MFLRIWFVFLLYLVGVFPAAHTIAAERSEIDFHVSGDESGQLSALIGSVINPLVNSSRLDDLGDVQLLYRRLRPIVTDALGAQGYFSVKMARVRDFDNDPKRNNRLVFKINPGQQSRIGQVDLRFEGYLAGDEPRLQSRRAKLIEQWRLSAGRPFEQARWQSSKMALLNDLLVRDYPAAFISESQALVDRDRGVVDLLVVYDSGPAYTFGPLVISGLSKYPPSVVHGQNTIQPGDPFEQDRLSELISGLQNTVYFSSVRVNIDIHSNPQLSPILVEVVESDSQRLGVGGGYSSNSGFRSELTYSLYNLFDRGYALDSGVRLEQKRQSVYGDVVLPSSRKGLMDAVGFSVDREKVNQLRVKATSVGIRREYVRGHSELTLGVNFQLEERFNQTVLLGETQALVAGLRLNYSQVDDRLNPTQGLLASFQVAMAAESLASDQDFVRLAGSVKHYWSLGPKHRLVARGELGTVIADLRDDIPQDFLFRTGGTNSVRGFPYLGLGVVSQGVVQGGRRLAVGSLEYTYWFNEPFGFAVFSDVGDVSDSWDELKPNFALGVGFRYLSPAGPISFDLAKAENQNKPRIHFALGVAF